MYNQKSAKQREKSYVNICIDTVRGTVYAPPTALYTMTNITRKVLIFKIKISKIFQYSGTNWYSIGAKNMKIPSLIMIFHEFFHYIGLPPQSVDLKRVLWKSIISQEKLMFWGADSRMTIKPD